MPDTTPKSLSFLQIQEQEQLNAQIGKFCKDNGFYRVCVALATAFEAGVAEFPNSPDFTGNWRACAAIARSIALLTEDD